MINMHDYHTRYRTINFDEYKKNSHEIVCIKFSEGNYLKYQQAVDDAFMHHEQGRIVLGYAFCRPIDNFGAIISGRQHADTYLEATKDVRHIIAGDVLDGPELIKVNGVWYNDPAKITADLTFQIVLDFFVSLKLASLSNLRLIYGNIGSWYSFYEAKWRKIENKEEHWLNNKDIISGSWEARYKANGPAGFGPFTNPILWQWDEASIATPPFPIKGVYGANGRIIDSDKNQLMIPFNEFLDLIPNDKRGKYKQSVPYRIRKYFRQHRIKPR